MWEWGRAQTPPQRALRMLAAVDPGASEEALAELSIGQRDAKLLALRERLFGPDLSCLATCPVCDQPVDLSFRVDDIRWATISESSPYPAAGQEGDEELSVSMAGYEVQFRLPNSRDLAAVAVDEAEAEARQHLLRRCIVFAERDGEAKTVDALPGDVLAAVVERMAEADPQSDVQLSITCPECAHVWQATFDIVSYLWAEIDAWAQRTLHEVHTLASTYAWPEVDILAMSPRRRQLYLEMAAP